MTIKKFLVASTLAMSGLLTVTHASAQAFVGASVGQSDIDEDITAGLITSGSTDSKDTAFKLFGGYMSKL